LTEQMQSHVFVARLLTQKDRGPQEALALLVHRLGY
jgi:hypothetical protein